MSTHARLLLVLGSSACAASAQADILYYKFDEAGGKSVVNYAAVGSVASTEGTIVTSNTQQFAAGRFGVGALKGSEGNGAYNYVDTGWNGAFTGSFSFAFFLKQRTALPDSLAYYLFGGPTQFRAFTSGAGGTGLRVGTWGGTPDLQLNTDIRGPAATRWVHVALVLDTATSQSLWYVDGALVQSTPVTGTPTVPTGTGNFLVGVHTRLTTGTWWDLDEFRFLNRAASAAEVMGWFTAPSAAEGKFGKGCGATLQNGGFGAPKPGSPLYAVTLGAAPLAPFVLALGASRLSFGAVPLPFDLGTLFPTLSGCPWHSSAEVTIPGLVPSSASALVVLPIPSTVGLVGASLWTQALCAGTPLQSSNAFAIAIGS